MTGLEDVDLAKVVPCRKCKTPTRMMGGIPIAGSNRDPEFPTTTTCNDCLNRQTTKAANAVRARLERERKAAR